MVDKKDASQTPLVKYLRPIFRLVHFLVPGRYKRGFRKTVVSRILCREQYLYLKVNSRKWICVPHDDFPGVDYVFYGDINIKRYNKNNLYPILAQAISPGYSIVSIGSSHGDEVVDLAQMAGENGRIYCLEPDPKNFEALQRTIAANDLENVSCFNMGVSDNDGKMTLYKTKQGRSTASSGVGTDKKISEVRVTTLDSFWKEKLSKSSIDLVVLDTDGSELKVISGATEFLENNPDCQWLVEFLPTMKYSGLVGTDALSWYHRHGFVINKIQQTSLELNESSFKEYVDQIQDPRYGISHDIFLTRKT